MVISEPMQQQKGFEPCSPSPQSLGKSAASSPIRCSRPGCGVRAVVRDAAKGAPWKARGCEVAVADFADAGQLARALEGTEGAFILLPPVFDPQPDFTGCEGHDRRHSRGPGAGAPTRRPSCSRPSEPTPLSPICSTRCAFSNRRWPISICRSPSCAPPGSWRMRNGTSLPRGSEGLITSYLQPLDRPVPDGLNPRCGSGRCGFASREVERTADRRARSGRTHDAERASLRPLRKRSESQSGRRSRHVRNGSKPFARRA